MFIDKLSHNILDRMSFSISGTKRRLNRKELITNAEVSLTFICG